MRLSPLLPVLCVGLAAPLFAQVPKDQVPQMQTVEPRNGTIGSVLKATGAFLGKNKVEEVYLTDHTFDMMVKVLAQSDDSIQFRIPPSVKPGKLQLLVKTAGKEPVLLEEPVYITVDEEKEADAKDAAKDTKEVAKDSKDVKGADAKDPNAKNTQDPSNQVASTAPSADTTR